MEQIVFPVPQICEFLTDESKMKIYYTSERDEQGSKVFDFFERAEDLFNEMKWQKRLRGRVDRYIFFLLFNLIVKFFPLNRTTISILGIT